MVGAESTDGAAVAGITGVYSIVAMATVSVSSLTRAKANEYEVTITNKGRIGLLLVR